VKGPVGITAFSCLQTVTLKQSSLHHYLKSFLSSIILDHWTKWSCVIHRTTGVEGSRRVCAPAPCLSRQGLEWACVTDLVPQPWAFVTMVTSTRETNCNMPFSISLNPNDKNCFSEKLMVSNTVFLISRERLENWFLSRRNNHPLSKSCILKYFLSLLGYWRSIIWIGISSCL
jgi:hypothetical protein